MKGLRGEAFMYLQSVTNIDEKGSLIRWDGNPSAICETDLQA